LKGRSVRLVGGAFCGLLLAAVVLGANPPPNQNFRDFEFQRLNRSYRDVPVAVEPVDLSPLHIALTSPRHDLVLLRHRLRLRRLTDGSHAAELWVQFQGAGHLVADVSALGLGTRLQDDVTLPKQDKFFEARLRIVRSKEGYLVTTVTLPKSAEVKLKSRLGADLVQWCDQIPFSLLRCDDLGRSLSSATLPLPAPGDTYLVSNADLTPEEKRALDGYLAGQ
jgi:hypothetical protein